MQETFNINLVMLVVVGIVALIMLFSMLSTIAIWMQAQVSGAPIPLLNIVFMRFRKVPPKLIMEARIMLVKAGLDIDTDKLEAHYLAGGNVMKVAQALIASHKAGKGSTFEHLFKALLSRVKEYSWQKSFSLAIRTAVR
ncbi:flotillin-like FloA family protein [Fibrobacterota bacterium]